MKKKVSKPTNKKMRAQQVKQKPKPPSKKNELTKKESKTQPKQNKESEIASQDFTSNKAQIGEIEEIEEISKRSELPKAKTYEIKTDDQIPYLLNFEQIKDKLKIKVTEKDSFPKNEYENYYSLEDLIKINNWFKIFYNIESLIIELEQLTKNESFAIEKKKKEVLSLYIIFPINLLEKIEIQLPINEIDNKDLFFQLISKINDFESKEKNDVNAIDEKLNNLEHLINGMELNINHEDENIGVNNENDNKQNDNLNLNEQNNQDENMNNIEEMKDALKQQIENNIKNSKLKENENENEQEKISQENSFQEQDVKSKNAYLLLDQNQLPFQESTILSENEQEKQKEIDALVEWLSPSLENLPNPPKVLRTKLIYKAEIDGDKALTFHEKCDNCGPTITIIQTKEGFRYGGYTSVSWEGPENPEFKADADAFIFSFDTMKKYDNMNAEKSIQCYSLFGPCFGDGIICVPDSFHDETNVFYQWPTTYALEEKDELTLGQENKINIKDYEVYIIEQNEVDSSEQE